MDRRSFVIGTTALVAAGPQLRKTRFLHIQLPLSTRSRPVVSTIS